MLLAALPNGGSAGQTPPADTNRNREAQGRRRGTGLAWTVQLLWFTFSPRFVLWKVSDIPEQLISCHFLKRLWGALNSNTEITSEV